MILLQEHKMYIFELTCDVLFIVYFPKLSDHFPKIFQNCSEGQTNVPKHFPKISEDCRRRSKKTRRCFDHTPTNLSTI